MGRKRHKITEQDLLAAWGYIQRKLKNETGWPVANNKRANKSLEESSITATELNSWCDEWLSREQWEKLRNAIIAARKRERDKGSDQGTKHIDLNHDAWRLLSDLAKHEGVTLSKFLVSRHRKEWLDLEMKRIKDDDQD